MFDPVSKVGDKLLEGVSLRTLYQVPASVVAASLLATWFGKAQPGLLDPDAGDGRLTALGSTPLAVIYRALSFMGVPHEWISQINDYLVANPSRTQFIASAALVFGLLLGMRLSPTHAKAPSVQASTWWLCAAVVWQCGGWFWLLVAGLIAWMILRALRGNADEWKVDVVQLAVAPLLIPLLPLAVIFHEWPRE